MHRQLLFVIGKDFAAKFVRSIRTHVIAVLETYGYRLATAATSDSSDLSNGVPS